jgi:hypothetical protein
MLSYQINRDSGLLDQLKSHQYINKDISIEYYDTPFHYAILNNVFNADIYQLLCSNFASYISRTVPYKDQPGAVHDYAGYIYGLKKEDCQNGYDFFIDPLWKNFCSSIFNIETNKYTALSAHWHKAPSKPGFVHKDLNICSTLISDKEDIELTGNCYYSDDSIDKQPHTLKIIRSIALLFYFNNKEPLEEEDKGGTSIYTHWGFDNFVKEVKPINNSIFIFEVCPDSFHGFSGANFDRSSVVQWFHSSPAYLLHRHLNRVKHFHKHFNTAYERWDRNNNPWPVDNDPEYNKYFNKSFLETLSEE